MGGGSEVVLRKWFILAAGALLVAALFLLRDGGDVGRLPAREGHPDGAGPAMGDPAPGQESMPTVLAGIFGTVSRDGRPAAARVELRLLGAADQSLPPSFQTMLPPVYFLQSPFSAREPDREVSADAGGEFAFDGVPIGYYEVRAICADGQTGRTVAHVNRPGQLVRADLTVEAGSHTLRGRAQFRDGRAFDGWVALTVEYEWLGGWLITYDDLLVAQPPIAGHTTRTDARGNFSVSGLRPGPYRISCLEEGAFRTLGPWVGVPRESEYVFVVDRGLVPLTGRVLAEDTDEPIPGATVWAAGHSTGGLDALTAVRTEEDGSFELRVPAECRGLLADAQGFRPCSFRVADEDAETEIRLARSARAQGTVVEQGSGKTPAGVTVFAVPREAVMADQILPISHTVTDASGRFAFDDLPPGVVSFGARGNGWVSPGFGALGGKTYDPNARSVFPGSDVELELEVVRPARIHGVVVSEEACPVPNAVLRVVQRGRSVGHSAAQHLLVSASTAGADGAFELEDVIPGLEGELIVSAPGYGEVRLPFCPVASGESADFEIRLAAGLWVEVKAVEEGGGKLLAGVSVRARRLGLRVLELQEAQTGEDGVARLGPLPAERLKLLVTHEGYIPVARALEFKPPASLTVEMRKTGGNLEISGTVLFEDKTIPYRAAVSASGPDDANRNGIPVDDRGAFRLTGLAPGRYSLRVIAFHEKWFSVEAEVQAGTSGIELVLEAEKPYEGSGGEVTRFHVLGPDGQPVDRGDLIVHYRGAHQWVDDWNQVKDGKASCRPPETREGFWVDVYRARSRSGARLDAGGALFGPFPKDQREVEVRLPAERRITGKVRDENGAPVPGVRVVAEPVYPFDCTGPNTHSETFAGPEGEFELRWLGDLEYVVKGDVPPEFLDLEPVKVRAGSRGVVLVLTRGCEPKITVLDDHGAPVPRTSFWIISLQGGTWSSSREGADADARGVAALTGLDPAEKYIVKISPPDDRPTLLDLELRDWEPRDTTIELQTGHFVRGVVRDSDGVPTGQAVVHGEEWNRRGSREKRVDVAGDGSFSIGPFYPGKVRLLALPPRASSWSSTEQWREVETGADDVRLVLKTRWKLTIRLGNIEEDARWSLDARLALDKQYPTGFGWWTRDFRRSGDRMVFSDLGVGKCYSLYVCHEESGRYALYRGLTRENPEIDLRLQAGCTLTGRVLLPPDPPPHRVIARGPGFEVRGRVEPDGTFEIRGVPPGPCDVGLWTSKGNTTSISYQHVKNGESVTFDLRNR